LHLPLSKLLTPLIVHCDSLFTSEHVNELSLFSLQFPSSPLVELYNQKQSFTFEQALLSKYPSQPVGIVPHSVYDMKIKIQKIKKKIQTRNKIK
jgi:hypothetical protein